MKVNESPERFDYPIVGDKDGVAVGTRVPMEYLCWWLGQVLYKSERPAIDKTGLDKQYDFMLSFAPDLPPGFPREKLPPWITRSSFDLRRFERPTRVETTAGKGTFGVFRHRSC
jgi:hypothetical protein